MIMKPQRIQLSRAAGFRLQAHSRSINGLPAVKCDRTTRFGNPYVVGEPVDRKQVRRWGWNFSPAGLLVVCATAEEAVKRFEHCLLWDEAIHDWLREQLDGKNPACWCDLDAFCHVDPMLYLVNSTKAEIHARHHWIDSQIMQVARSVP
jgi:hypothetical protein